MKRNGSIVFCLVICSLAIYIIVLNIRNEERDFLILENLNAKNDSLRLYKSFVDDIGMFVNCSLKNCYIYNVISKQKIELYNKLRSNSIIYKIANNSCASCIENQIKMIEYIQKFENIIVLSNGSNIRQIRLFVNNNHILTDVYQTENSHLLFEGDEIDKSYILYVDKNGSILSYLKIDTENIFLIKYLLQKYNN